MEDVINMQVPLYGTSTTTSRSVVRGTNNSESWLSFHTHVLGETTPEIVIPTCVVICFSYRPVHIAGYC